MGLGDLFSNLTDFTSRQGIACRYNAPWGKYFHFLFIPLVKDMVG